MPCCLVVITQQRLPGTLIEPARRLTLPRDLIFKQSLVGDHAGGRFHRAGDGRVHFADRLPQHGFGGFELFDQLVQIGRDDVTDASEHSHRKVSLAELTITPSAKNIPTAYRSSPASPPCNTPTMTRPAAAESTSSCSGVQRAASQSGP